MIDLVAPPRTPRPPFDLDEPPTAPIQVPTQFPQAFAGALHRHHDTADKPRQARWLPAAAALLAVIALVAVAVAAYLLGARAQAPAVPDPAANTAQNITATTEATPSGPQLLEKDGNPVDAEVAAQVRDVFQALTAGDLPAVRVAYGAAGSDDGLTSEPYLKNSATRSALLAALQTHPAHVAQTYRYSSAGYTLEFNQAQGPLHAGLGRITGPWTTKSTPTSKTTSNRAASTTTASASKTSAKAASSCAAGSHPGGDGFYPCTDDATGAAVGTDGTFGVHGLKPCPPGTRLTDGVGHNPKTGAVCAMP